MVTALRKLHAGKVREDGRLEIPNLDGHAAYSNEAQEETSEIISFAESGSLSHNQFYSLNMGSFYLFIYFRYIQVGLY